MSIEHSTSNMKSEDESVSHSDVSDCLQPHGL